MTFGDTPEGVGVGVDVVVTGLWVAADDETIGATTNATANTATISNGTSQRIARFNMRNPSFFYFETNRQVCKHVNRAWAR